MNQFGGGGMNALGGGVGINPLGGGNNGMNPLGGGGLNNQVNQGFGGINGGQGINNNGVFGNNNNNVGQGMGVQNPLANLGGGQNPLGGGGGGLNPLGGGQNPLNNQANLLGGGLNMGQNMNNPLGGNNLGMNNNNQPGIFGQNNMMGKQNNPMGVGFGQNMLGQNNNPLMGGGLLQNNPLGNQNNMMVNQNNLMGNQNNMMSNQNNMMANQNNPLGNQNNMMGMNNNQFNAVASNLLNPMAQTMLNNPQAYQGFVDPLSLANSFPMTKENLQTLLRDMKMIRQLLKNVKLHPQNTLKRRKLKELDPSLQGQLNELFKIIDELNKQGTKIKQTNHQLAVSSNEMTSRLLSDLESYKQALLIAVASKKIRDQVAQQLTLLSQQINKRLSKVYNSIYNRRPQPFADPDDFCLRVARDLLMRMNSAHQRLQEMLIAKGSNGQDLGNQDHVQLMEQLIHYYMRVAARVKSFEEKFKEIKHKSVESARLKSRRSNLSLKDLQFKAETKVNAEFKNYELLREIQEKLNHRNRFKARKQLTYE